MPNAAQQTMSVKHLHPDTPEDIETQQVKRKLDFMQATLKKLLLCGQLIRGDEMQQFIC